MSARSVVALNTNDGIGQIWQRDAAQSRPKQRWRWNEPPDADRRPGRASESPISTAAPPPKPPARKKSRRALSGDAMRATPSPRPVISRSSSSQLKTICAMPGRACRPRKRARRHAVHRSSGESRGSAGDDADGDADAADARSATTRAVSWRGLEQCATPRRQRDRACPRDRSRRAPCAPSRVARRLGVGDHVVERDAARPNLGQRRANANHVVVARRGVKARRQLRHGQDRRRRARCRRSSCRARG